MLIMLTDDVSLPSHLPVVVVNYLGSDIHLSELCILQHSNILKAYVTVIIFYLVHRRHELYLTSQDF